ncbi:hypothetical protein [Geotoga petraea]|uniref:Uncharacterized protein n=1 Tax=Geotoga petraea TaxID=28234 RepID=A0A4Z0VYI9_9BACT|nr:hypothetical protein [Geotoga petraea]TGG86967.1 hypothetical protein E4650_08905 [Geotoga petraea]
MKKKILVISFIVLIISSLFATNYYVYTSEELQIALEQDDITSIILTNKEYIGNFKIKNANDIFITSKNNAKLYAKDKSEPIFYIKDSKDIRINSLNFSNHIKDKLFETQIGIEIDNSEYIKIENNSFENLSTVLKLKNVDNIDIFYNEFISNNFLLKTENKMLDFIGKKNNEIYFLNNVFQNQSDINYTTNRLYLEEGKVDFYNLKKAKLYFYYLENDVKVNFFDTNISAIVELNNYENTLFNDWNYYVDISSSISREIEELLKEKYYDLSYLYDGNLIIYSENLKKEIEAYNVDYFDLDRYIYLINEYIIRILPYNDFYNEEYNKAYKNELIYDLYREDKIYLNFIENNLFNYGFYDEFINNFNNYLDNVIYKNNNIGSYLPNLKSDKKLIFYNNRKIYEMYKLKKDYVKGIIKDLKNNASRYNLTDKQINKVYKYDELINNYLESYSKFLRIKLFDVPLNLYFMRTYYELMHTEKEDENQIKNIYLQFSDLAYIYAYGAVSNATNIFQTEIIRKIKDILEIKDGDEGSDFYQGLKTIAETSSNRYKEEVEKLFE